MENPAVLALLKNIFLWTKSSDRSRLNRPFSTRADGERVVNALAAATPECGYGDLDFSASDAWAVLATLKSRRAGK
jgi:hypothetical protein